MALTATATAIVTATAAPITSATTTATTSAALYYLLYFKEDPRLYKKRKIASRPRKYTSLEDVVEAKLASNQASYHRRKLGL